MDINEIHDMIQKTNAGDTDRILDILLEMLEHIKQHDARLKSLAAMAHHGRGEQYDN